MHWLRVCAGSSSFKSHMLQMIRGGHTHILIVRYHLPQRLYVLCHSVLRPCCKWLSKCIRTLSVFIFIVFFCCCMNELKVTNYTHSLTTSMHSTNNSLLLQMICQWISNWLLLLYIFYHNYMDLCKNPLTK